ncbi:MAG: HAMP domain-containing protein, partial [Chloroflexota bacterium]|nr:HAMP domain-containing protein [Chloroflexota bacterium]
MSLRLRLTMLYATLMGAILFVMGMALLMVVSILLLNQIDDQLEAVHKSTIENITVNQMGKVEINFADLELGPDVYVQVWSVVGELQSSFGNFENFENKPFDPNSLRIAHPIYRNLNTEDWHIRVLSIPLEQRGHVIAVLQIASDLRVFDEIRANLLDVISIIWIVAVLFSGIIVWLTLGQSLKPLDAITKTAEQINRADDLSRRIPYYGPAHNEIGNLVGSFNQTLERLEALFTSQQRLLADVSHELRTPLTVIKGNADLMRRMKSFDMESLTSIDQEAGRLSRLVGG